MLPRRRVVDDGPCVRHRSFELYVIFLRLSSPPNPDSRWLSCPVIQRTRVTTGRRKHGEASNWNTSPQGPPSSDSETNCQDFGQLSGC